MVKKEGKMQRFLMSDSVSLTRIQEVVSFDDFRLYPDEKSPFLTEKNIQTLPKHLTLLADEFEDLRLNALFSLPVERIVDAQSMDESINDFIAITNKEDLPNSFSCLLTCPVLYRCDVAKIFVKALNQRLKLTPERSAGIHLALHEAIVNGLIHGNLDISSEYRQSARSFIEYSRILSERLQNPAYARKSLSLSAAWDNMKLRIKIRDEGAGYQR